MQLISLVITVAALLGSALVAGTFFAFSSFVMPALCQLPHPRGLEAMQQINRSVLNRWFLGVFMGTGVLSAAVISLAVAYKPSASVWSLLASVLYLVGSFGITAARNVPLNNELDAVDPQSPSAGDAWNSYALMWTRWNHVRTVASIVSTAAFAIALRTG